MTRTTEAQWFNTTAVPLVGGKALVKTQTRPDHALCLLPPRDFKRRFQLESSQDVQQFFPSPQPSLNPCLHLPDRLPLSLPVSARLPHAPSENSTRLGHQHLLDKHVSCLAPGSLSSCACPYHSAYHEEPGWDTSRTGAEFPRWSSQDFIHKGLV